MKRALSVILAMLLLCALLALPAGADSGNVCFLAVNDSIPGTLDDATMPFFSSGQLYIPYSIFYTAALGVTPAYSGSTLTLTGPATALVFQLSDGTVTEGGVPVQASPALLQNGVVFVPLSFCAQAFGFSVSYLTSRNHYAVVRVTTGAEVYSDALFIQKADTLLETRVAEYLAASAPPAADPAPTQPSQPATPAAPESPATPAAPQAPDPQTPPEEPEPEPPAPPIELLPAITGAASMPEAQTALETYGVDGVYFFTAEEIVAYPDLVTSLYTSGVRVGVTSPAGSEDPAAELQRANDRLYQLLHTRSLLALLPAEAGTPAGYLSLSAQSTNWAETESLAGQTVPVVCTGTELQAILTTLTQNEVPFTVSQLTEAALQGA